MKSTTPPLAPAPTARKRQSRAVAKRQLPRSLLFRKQREEEWEELNAMVNRALSRGLGALRPEELERLPALYRNTLSSLMVARETALDRELIRYLEALSARAYLLVYGSRRYSRAPILEFLLREFPRQVRDSLPELALSAAVVLLGAVVSALLVTADPSWYDSFVGPDLSAGRTPETSTEELRAGLYQAQTAGLSSFSSYLFAHNAGIGLFCFALGIGAGLPTIALLFLNGTMLGAFLALYIERGLLLPVLGWLLPHGIPEFLAIMLCGAAGLKIGRGLLFPGRLELRESLRFAGQNAATLVAGCLLLFLVAGLIEGMFRQLVTSDAIRWAVALANLAWISAWLYAGGRRQKSTP